VSNVAKLKWTTSFKENPTLHPKLERISESIKITNGKEVQISTNQIFPYQESKVFIMKQHDKDMIEESVTCIKGLIFT